MLVVRLQKALAVALCLCCVPLYAQVPSIPDGPNGPLFSCQQYEDEFGCFGYLEFNDGFEMSLGQARRFLKRQIRRTRRAIRRLRRQGGFDEIAALRQNIAQLKSVREGVFSCVSYDDPFCEEEQQNPGQGGGNQSGGNLGGNQSLSEACQVLGGNSSSDRFGLRSIFHRIVNGAQCRSEGAPTVRILNNGFTHCTGTVVRSNKIVTAAHCVQGPCSRLTIDDGAGNSVGLSSCVAHPSYNDSTLDYDLAVLTTTTPLSNRTIPIKTSGAPSVGTTIALAGYGRNLSEQGEALPESALLATFAVITEVNNQVIEFTYDSYNANFGNTCNGDSGGPHVENVGGTWMLVGATSSGYAENCGMTEGSDTSFQANLTSQWAQSFLAQQGCL